MNESPASLREIRMFIAAYEERSFTAAALREHATQSGVSQHIRHIENRLGTQLFNRQNAMLPTAAGDAYYTRCLEVLKAHHDARRSVQCFSTGLSGDVSIGLPPALTNCQLAPAYLRFRSAHPNASIRIVEAHDSALTERVQSGELDCAVVPGSPRPVRNLSTSVFIRTPALLVSSTASALVHGQALRLADLTSLKLILPNAFARPSAIDAYLTAHRIEASRFELDAVLGTLDLVRVSDWKAILPGLLLAHELMAAPPERDFTINPLYQPGLTLDMLLVEPERQPLSAVARAFLDILLEIAEEHNLVALALTAS